MALPQQAVERLTRAPSPETQGAYQNLLFFSAAIFILMLVLYLGLDFGYRPFLNNQVSDLEAQIQQFTQEISLEEQEQLVRFYSQIANIQALLGNHVVATPALDLLADTVQLEVVYTDAQLNTANGELRLSGTAPSLQDVSEQVALLESDPAVNRVSFNEVIAADQAMQFSMTVFLSSNFVHPNGQ